MAFEQKITLGIKEQDFVFNVNAAAYDKMQADLSKPNAKMKQTFTNFLMAVIDKNQQEDFENVIKKPGAPATIASAVIDEYQEDFDIVVKK